jgi:hypothetical protein
MMTKEISSLKCLYKIKNEMINKAGIGRAGFQELKHRHQYIYIYMRLIGLAMIEGNLQTHAYRFGIQPNNFNNRIKEIQWQKLI